MNKDQKKVAQEHFDKWVEMLDKKQAKSEGKKGKVKRGKERNEGGKEGRNEGELKDGPKKACTRTVEMSYKKQVGANELVRYEIKTKNLILSYSKEK